MLFREFLLFLVIMLANLHLVVCASLQWDKGMYRAAIAEPLLRFIYTNRANIIKNAAFPMILVGEFVSELNVLCIRLRSGDFGKSPWGRVWGRMRRLKIMVNKSATIQGIRLEGLDELVNDLTNPLIKMLKSTKTSPVWWLLGWKNSIEQLPYHGIQLFLIEQSIPDDILFPFLLRFAHHLSIVLETARALKCRNPRELYAVYQSKVTDLLQKFQAEQAAKLEVAVSENHVLFSKPLIFLPSGCKKNDKHDNNKNDFLAKNDLERLSTYKRESSTLLVERDRETLGGNSKQCDINDVLLMLSNHVVPATVMDAYCSFLVDQMSTEPDPVRIRAIYSEVFTKLNAKRSDLAAQLLKGARLFDVQKGPLLVLFPLQKDTAWYLIHISLSTRKNCSLTLYNPYQNEKEESERKLTELSRSVLDLISTYLESPQQRQVFVTWSDVTIARNLPTTRNIFESGGLVLGQARAIALKRFNGLNYEEALHQTAIDLLSNSIK